MTLVRSGEYPAGQEPEDLAPSPPGIVIEPEVSGVAVPPAKVTVSPIPTRVGITPEVTAHAAVDDA